MTYVRYDNASGDQYLVRWPAGHRDVRRGTSATSVGEPPRTSTTCWIGPGSVRACSPSCRRWPTRWPPAAPWSPSSRTIISHGLPRPDNLRVAREIEEAVRARRRRAGDDRRRRRACRTSGWTTPRCEQVADRDDVVKVSIRDLATVAARGGSGATTVAATAHLAALAGIGVFATGGLGGVHRDARDTWDESADLTALAPHADHRRLRRREVDPRRRRPPWSGWRRSASTVVGYGTDRVPRLLPHRLRATRSTGGSTPRARSPR